MPRFSAGSASVSIVPDLRGFQTTISRELARLGNGVNVPVKLDVDRSGLNDLNRTISAQSPKVKVGVDTSQAKTALAGLAKLSAASFATMGTQAAVGGLVAVAGAAAQAGGALALLPALGAAAAAPLAALVVGGQGIATAFKAANKATADAGASATASAAAQKAAAKQIESAQKGVAAASRQVEDAQRGLEDAARGVEDAQRGVTDATHRLEEAQRAAAEAGHRYELAQRDVDDALQRVRDAELEYADAQRTTRQTQLDLNDARQQAVRDLQDMNTQLKDSALDEESAVLAVERARLRLAEATAVGSKATDLDRKEADLAYRQSVQNLEDVRVRNARLADEVAAANKAGVEGSDGVVRAHEKVATSIQGEQDAQRSLADAQRGVADAQYALGQAGQGVADAQYNIAQAQLGVADANRDVADAQRGVVDAQRGLADAQQGVIDAQKDLADAIAESTTGAEGLSKSAAGLATAMAALSPAARDFVQSVQALGPAFTAMRLDVQERLFAGLGDRIRLLGDNYLPVLATGLGGIASLMNGAVRDGFDVLNQASSVKDTSSIFSNITSGFGGITAATGPLTQALLDITAVGSTFLPELGAGLGGVLQGLADFISESRESGALAEFIQLGIDTLGQLGGILANVGRIIFSVFSAGAEVGGGFLNTIQEVTGQIADFLSSVEGQTALQTFFTAVAEAVRALAPLLTTIASTILGTVGPALAGLATQLAPIAQVLLTALAEALQSIAPLMPLVGAAIGALALALAPLLPIVAELIGQLLPPLADLIQLLAPYVSQLAVMIGQALVQALDMIVPYLPQLFDGFTAFMEALLPLLPVILDLALKLIPPLVEILAAIIPVIVAVIEAIAPFLTQLVTYLTPAIVWLAKMAAEGFKVIADIVTWAVNEIVVPILGFLMEGIKAVGTIFTGLWDGVVAVWGGIGSAISGAWDFISGIFDSFKGGIGLIGDAFGVFRDVVSSIWGEVQSILVTAINGVIGFINTFLDAINWIADKVGIDLNLHIDPISTIGPGGSHDGNRGNGRVAQGFATGGEVLNGLPGGTVPGTGNRDTVDIRAMPGEIVVRKAISTRFKDFLLALNAGQPEAMQAAGGGRLKVQAFAKGGSVKDAQAWARQQEGKPYIWGGVGPVGYDCSGLMSDIANFITGTPMHQRRFATASMAGGRDAGGFKRGDDGSFVIGVDPGSHTAGTLGGINVESGSGHGPMVGKRALGADSGFQYKYFLPEAGMFRAALGEIAQAVANPILSGVRGIGGAAPLLQVASGSAAHLIQSVVDWIGGVDTTSYNAKGGDSGNEPAGITAARSALVFDSGGFLPPGYSTVYNGTGAAEPLARLKRPEQLTTSDFSSAGGVVGMQVNGNVIVRDYDELRRRQDRAARATRATVGL